MWNDEQREKGRIRIAERAQIRKKAIQIAKTDNPHLSYRAIGDIFGVSHDTIRRAVEAMK